VRIVYFDIAALVLLLGVLAMFSFKGRSKGRGSRSFLWLLITSIVSTITSIATTYMLKFSTGSEMYINFMYAVQTVYLVTHLMTAFIYVFYVAELTGTIFKWRNHPVLTVGFFIPFFITTAICVSNFFTHEMYWYKNHQYLKGGLFVSIYISAIFYLFFGLVYLLNNWKPLGTGRTIATISIVPLILMAVTVQMIWPEMVVEMFCCSLGILFATTAIQKSGENLDSVTGLMRNSAFTEDVQLIFENKIPSNMIVINIKNFGIIQTKASYEEADRLLKMVADVLVKIDKKNKSHASMYRLLQGNICVVFNSTDYEENKKLAHSIYTEIEKAFDGERFITPPIWRICTIDTHENFNTTKSFMNFIVDFITRNKDEFVVVAAEDLLADKNFVLLSRLDYIIEEAIKNNRFEVYYQPLYSTVSKKFESAEALIRLKDPDFGMVSPALFIPEAEKNGAIFEIGDFVMEEVCKFISSDEFKQSGLDHIEINLSVAQCMQPDLVDKLKGHIEKYRIRPEQLDLEITETYDDGSARIFESNLKRLTQMGVHFALDDYGVGYSNIKRVASLPFETVKLDKVFVDELANPKMQIIVKNTVNMLKDMNMKVVVEGIETENMVEECTNLKCDYIQGFYFSKPLPKSEFLEFLKANI